MKPDPLGPARGIMLAAVLGLMIWLFIGGVLAVIFRP
jgi:hypothetical protein